MADREDIYAFYKVQLEKLATIYPSRFVVVRYSWSLKQLIIRVTPLHQVEKQRAPLYVQFIGVEYLSLLPRWEGAMLTIIPLDETRGTLEQIGISYDSEKPPYVVCAQPSDLRLYVVCHIIWVHDKMPKIYAYEPGE